MAPTLLGNIKTFINQCLPDYIINSWSNTAQTGKAPSESLVKTALNNKSDVGHTHNYASISDIDVEIEAYLDAIIDALEEAEIIGGGGTVDIATQWGTPLSDSKVPSEKLVKELLDTKANSSSIPTKTSDLTNDSGYVTSSGSTVSYSQTQSSGTNTYTIGKITINGTETTLYGKDTNTTYTIPSASTSTPAKDTTSGTYGSGTAYARANHAHPKSSIYAEAEHEHDTDDIDGLINLIYPVGSIYINMVDQTSPATKFPGTTWDRITNRFIYGCADGEAGMTGGAATVTLNESQIPSHTHNAWTKAESGWAIWGQRSGNMFSTSSYTWEGSNVNVSDINSLTNTGGGQAHDNMPPYVKAYMWVRVS